MTRILAYRFSAFGDVAMAAVVFREFLEQNPDVEIVMVSRKNFAALFQDMPRLRFHGIDVEQYKGFFGIRKLSAQLYEQYKPAYVADLHDVIRSKMLDRFFREKGFIIHKINKGKEDKKQLTDIRNLNKHQLKQTVERYADVFREMGFPLTLSHTLRPQVAEKYGIGFAPFAQHSGKMLPLEKSFEIAKELAQKFPVYFFGAAKDESALLETWQQKIPNTKNLAGKLTLREELEKIASLQLMISMDSANMHLASLMGTRCISIWCATHPFAGFLGYGQSADDVVQQSDLTCRPCSVFGDEACYRGDYACRYEIPVQQVLEKIIR